VFSLVCPLPPSPSLTVALHDGLGGELVLGAAAGLRAEPVVTELVDDLVPDVLEAAAAALSLRPEGRLPVLRGQRSRDHGGAIPLAG